MAEGNERVKWRERPAGAATTGEKWSRQTQGLLPVTCVDGEVAKTRTYPTYEELLVLTGIAAEPEDARGEQRPRR